MAQVCWLDWPKFSVDLAQVYRLRSAGVDAQQDLLSPIERFPLIEFRIMYIMSNDSQPKLSHLMWPSSLSCQLTLAHISRIARLWEGKVYGLLPCTHRGFPRHNLSTKNGNSETRQTRAP